jgi:hypothetical protein
MLPFPVILAISLVVTTVAAQGAPVPPPRPLDLPRYAPPAAAPPLPPERPKDLLTYAPEPKLQAPPPVPAATLTEETAACDALLASGRVVATKVAPVVGDGGCGIAAPVSLNAVFLADRRRIDISPSPVMRCDLADRVGRWIAEDVAPLVESSARKLVRVASLDSYDCRGRNRQAGAKLSEHGKGDALDMGSAVFADGSSMHFADKGNDLSVATLMRTSACARFSTVLGPGSDGFHEDHVHLDLEARKHSGKICQWDLR